MSIFLRMVGIVFFIAAIIVVIAFLSEGAPLLAVLLGLMTISVGLSLFAVAGVMDRVAFLELRLNMRLPESDEDLPQIKCPDCGREYDFDYPKCPYCGKSEQD